MANIGIREKTRVQANTALAMSSLLSFYMPNNWNNKLYASEVLSQTD